MASCAAPAGRKRSQTVRATAANDSSNDAATVRTRTRKKGDIDLTRSRPNYSAIKGGKIRPNPLAFLAVGRKNDVHERDCIASANGRQTKTARPGARRDSAQTFQHSH